MTKDYSYLVGKTLEVKRDGYGFLEEEVGEFVKVTHTKPEGHPIKVKGYGVEDIIPHVLESDQELKRLCQQLKWARKNLNNYLYSISEEEK